jgi:branched-chain amino acid transport system substrate-binding protein
LVGHTVLTLNDLQEDAMRYLGYIAAALMGVALGGGGLPAEAATPIQIGFSMPLTGPYAVSGKQALIAMKLWEDDVNASGGLLHRPVKLVYYDDQSNPANVPGIYTKLIDVDKVDLVVGPYGTVLTAPAMPVVMAHNMVFTSLVSLNVNSHFHYPRYFSVTASGTDPIADFSKSFFQAAMQQTPKPETIGFVGGDQEFAKQNLAGAKENAKAAHLKVVFDETYPPSTADYSPIIRAAQATNPDILYAASYPPETVGLVHAMHEVGFQPKIFGGAMVGLQITNIQMSLGPLLNGIVAFAAWEPVPVMEYPGVMHMLERYRSAAKGQGVDPLGYFLAPAAYAYVQLLGEAVEQAGTLDQAKLAQYIHTHTFSTVDGKFAFNELGDATDNRLLYVQYHGIRGHDLDEFTKPAQHMTIVAPAALSTGKLIYPFAKALM